MIVLLKLLRETASSLEAFVKLFGRNFALVPRDFFRFSILRKFLMLPDIVASVAPLDSLALGGTSGCYDAVPTDGFDHLCVIVFRVSDPCKLC